MNIYIVASTFYKDLTDELISGAVKQTSYDVNIVKVPGAFEIPGMVKQILDNKNPDLIVTLGVLIKGETAHFEYISNAVSNSISKLSIISTIPIINFSVTE